MEMDLKARGKEAFVDDNFELAVELYTQALDMDPNDADLFADRAQANIKLKNFTEAVADANRAIELDRSMSKAYLRKGTACMKLEEYRTAKTALEAGMALAPEDSRFTKLILECDERIAEETGVILPKALSTSPSVSPPSEIASENAKDMATSLVAAESAKDMETSQAIAPVKLKYRHDYYNTPTEVVLTIFAKGIPSENVHINFGEQILGVLIEVPGEESYHFQPRLFGKIIPSKCRYTILSSKIEIRLWKADAITWMSLEFSKDKKVPQKINVSSASVAHRSSYPSSKTKINWDKLEAQVKKEEKEEKLEGDAALNKLFRDIYKDADEDMRRAMQKSFVESNGTVLSTNWKEVAAKKVEGTPPDGMELKKWEY